MVPLAFRVFGMACLLYTSLWIYLWVKFRPKATALAHSVYDKDVRNYNAFISGFNKQPMFGRVISISYLHLGKVGVKDVLFFVLDDGGFDIAAVLGAGVLNGLVPIPDFDAKLIWIYKNKNMPKPHFSKNLGVAIPYNVLAQDDSQLHSKQTSCLSKDAKMMFDIIKSVGTVTRNQVADKITFSTPIGDLDKALNELIKENMVVSDGNMYRLKL